LIEQIARPLVETQAQRELRHGVEQAFVQYENRLKADFEQTRSYLEAARGIVSAQAVERTLRAGHELPAPEPSLTPKQAMSIEIYAERQADPNEREHLLRLARGSALSHFDSHSHTDSPEPHAAREVAPVIERGR
jgi:plasmid stabilization system protein ParE